jgi:GT2 family glycosyltransferase
VSDPSGLLLDPRVRVLDGGRTLAGGDPWRMLRLSERGAAVLRELLEGAADARGGTAAGQDTRAGFARRLIDAGLAHPRPAPAPAREVTVVIPVRDRAAELDRCLTALLEHEAPGRVLVVDDGSRDPEAVLAVCARHGCELVRRERPGGPAVARNAALARIDSGLVALLDSDCVAQPGWLSLLCGALEADPRLGAVAPRVVALGASGTGDAAPEVGGAHGRPGPDARAVAAGRRSALVRFAAVRSPLDLGPRPSLVRPGGRTSYVPTAALLARREALGRAPLDPALRLGEDVDLVWRLLDRGWSVRYEPAAVVGHREPARLGSWLLRRFRYGTSAGPLARRHPGRLAPVSLPPRTLAALAAVGTGLSRRRPGATAVAVGAVALHLGLGAHGLSRRGVPPRLAWTLALRGLGDSAAALGRAATMLAPVPLTAGLLSGRSRGTIIAAMGRGPARTLTLIVLLAAPVRDLVRLRPALDPWRFAALSVADDLAYGTGVWAGALRARTCRPLQPRIIRPAGAGTADSCDPHG